MKLISSRTIPSPDTGSLASGIAREALFRDLGGSFILYLSDGKASRGEERVIPLSLREALIWFNEPAQYQGSFWR